MNKENFNSSEGVTFGEYPTSSKTQDFLGDIQTSSQFDQQFPGATNIVSSSTEASAFETLSRNMGNAQYDSSFETLPTINAVNNYETLETNNTGQNHAMNTNISSATDITSDTQALPIDYLRLTAENAYSDKQVQNIDIIPSSSSSQVLNTFQSSSSNYNDISLGNFQTPSMETNSNNFGEVVNSNQGELFNLPVEYSSEANNNKTFDFNDFKATSSIETEASLQLQTTDTITSTNFGGSYNDNNYLNTWISTNGFESQTSKLFEGNYDANALSSGITTTNDLGFDAQTNLNLDTGASIDLNNLGNVDNYQINSSTTVDTGMPLTDYQNSNIITNTTTTGFDTLATSSVENLQSNTNFQTTENYETFNDINTLSSNAFEIKQNDTETNPSFNLNELQTNSESTSYQATQTTVESNPTFDLNAFQTSTNIDTFSTSQNYDSNILQSSNPINEVSSSFDLNALQATSTFDTSPIPQTSENNAFQIEQYDLNALQTTETTGNTQTYDIKDYQTSTPSIDLNVLQTTEAVNTQTYDFKDYHTSTPSIDLSSLQTTGTVDSNQTYDIKDYLTSTPSIDLNTIQTTSTMDNIQTYDIKDYQASTPSFDLNAIQTSSTIDNIQTYDIKDYQASTPSFDLNAIQTTEKTQNYDIKDYQTSTPSIDLNAIQTTSTIDNAQTYDIKDYQISTPSIDFNTQNLSNLLDTNQFQTTNDNISSLNSFSSPQTIDMNTYQTSAQLTPSISLNTPESTQFTDIASIQPTTSFNFNTLQDATTIDTSSSAQILDPGAIQAVPPTIDTTPSFDLNNLQINTTPLFNTSSAFEGTPTLSNYTPLIDSNSALQSFETSNLLNTQASEIINPSYNFNNQIATNEPILNISTFPSTAQVTPIIDKAIASTTSNNLEGFITDIPSSNLLEVTPIQTDNATFGEYNNVANVSGVASQYMPQIDSTLNTSYQQTSVAIPISSSQILPTQSIPIPSTYTRKIESPMDISIPKLSIPQINLSSSMMVPSTVPGPLTTPRKTSTSRVVPFTFSPSQNDLIKSQSFINSPLRSQIITESRIFSPGRKLYSSPTYRAYLGKKGKNLKYTHRRIKSLNNGKLGSAMYRPRDYNKLTEKI